MSATIHNRCLTSQIQIHALLTCQFQSEKNERYYFNNFYRFFTDMETKSVSKIFLEIPRFFSQFLAKTAKTDINFKK